jgi:hypothetical protein
MTIITWIKYFIFYGNIFLTVHTTPIHYSCSTAQWYTTTTTTTNTTLKISILQNIYWMAKKNLIIYQSSSQL